MPHPPLPASAHRALTDSFGRSFGYLRLSVTEQCNFRCLYCLPDGSHCEVKTELNLQEIKQLVTVFAELGTSKVRITGGEPSLRKDLTAIIDTVKNIPGIASVAFRNMFKKACFNLLASAFNWQLLVLKFLINWILPLSSFAEIRERVSFRTS